MDTWIYQNYMDKKNMYKNLYKTLNTTWYEKKYKYNTYIRIVKSNNIFSIKIGDCISCLIIGNLEYLKLTKVIEQVKRIKL